MGKIIAVCNQKGGVGKTTATINLGAALNKLGHSVLLVDADPQGHLTVGLGENKQRMQQTLENLMRCVIMDVDIAGNAEEFVVDIRGGKEDEPKLALICSNKMLAGMDYTILRTQSMEVDSSQIMAKALEPYRNDYDYIFIDCMPSLGSITTNALNAADSVIVVMNPEYYAVDGFIELMNTLNTLGKGKGKPTVIEGVLYNKDRAQLNNSKMIKSTVQDFCDNFSTHPRIFNTTIPLRCAYTEATGAGCSIFEYKGKTDPIEERKAFLDLADELLERA